MKDGDVPTDRSAHLDEVVRLSEELGLYDRPDLDALADRLDLMIQWAKPTGEALDDLGTAARIVRAVAAAPGPLRHMAISAEASGEEAIADYLDALADVVGERESGDPEVPAP